MCAMVYLWKSEYSFQDLAHPFLLWGSRTEIQVISTWQSPLISEPPHWLRRLHFFFFHSKLNFMESQRKQGFCAALSTVKSF